METLKISDLSVGDWVAWKDRRFLISAIYSAQVGFPHEVALIYPDAICASIVPNEDLDPIPITPEILEANGLFRHEVDADNPKRVVMSNSCMLARTYEDVDWWRVLIYDEEELSAQLFNGIVYFVHQLQHALRLAGVEKEIIMPNK